MPQMDSIARNQSRPLTNHAFRYFQIDDEWCMVTRSGHDGTGLFRRRCLIDIDHCAADSCAELDTGLATRDRITC
jgi:hypothetical protein